MYIPNAFGGSESTKSAEEHNSPCWTKTTGRVTFTSPFLYESGSFLLYGIRCIVRIYPSSVVTICVSDG